MRLMDEVEDSDQGRVFLLFIYFKEVDFVIAYPDLVLFSGDTKIVEVAIQSLKLCLLSLA